MPIPPEIQTVIDRLDRELNEIEQESTEGLNLTRELLSRFSDNAILTQFFASFSSLLFFVETYRNRVETIVEQLSVDDVPGSVIQEAGEDLGTMLGRVTEARINASRLKNRLEN
jgi:hypothetical protein